MPERDRNGFRGLRLSNTLTRSREKEDFVPIHADNVRMYVCGPTVYDFAHIGNARPVIVFDVLFRLLRHLYGEDHVTYVRNITDVDDKINARAAEEFPGIPLNEAIRRVTEKTERQYHEDVAALGALPPTIEPRATEHIEDMLRMTQRLVERGHAYPAEGHVLFDVHSWTNPDGSLEYGKLANRSLDDMIAGARVEIAPYKRNPMDFVLWKPSAPGEPAWQSPWGAGRPGWHLECSAMSERHLGAEFDIHGGGIDLVFPHHENEIAQSRCAHGTKVMANYWLHNGHLQVQGEKMSKSLGNFDTIHSVLQDWHGDVARLNMLRTHYRQPAEWTLASMQESEKILVGWFDAASDEADPRPADAVIDALLDDLNTPKAIAELHALKARAGHKALAGSLAFLGFRREEFLDAYAAKAPTLAIANEEIERQLAARLDARKAKNFAEADRIRAELEGAGVQLMDKRDPTTGEITTTWEVRR
ncbi:MAG: cysteine--tRNA ligase [Bauldia sp.]